MNFFGTDCISCKPISNLSSLINWCSKTEQKYNTVKLKHVYCSTGDQVPKFLVCHDMKNNYLGDRFYQGFNSPTEFSFYHWNLIDTFIYFSHHFVTIPTESWINAAHENNCRILGTIITEFDEGEKICSLMFENLDPIVDKLVEITLYYGFDGWLINIENKINQIEKLEYFVKSLREKLKKIDDKLYQVIWYDSVINTGELKWQNELNSSNEQFFNISDGIFLNYTWTDDNLKKSINVAKERSRDVYVGIDVFGRGCHGNGGFNTCQAVQKIHDMNLSFALFAPGWVHECNDEVKFFENNQKFWSLLQMFTVKRKIKHLPILSSFSHASGKNFFIQGQKFADTWNNLNLQSLMPFVHNSQWDFEDGFFGASCLTICPGLNTLFDLDLEVNSSQTFIFELVFKAEADMKIMLSSKNMPNIELTKDNPQLFFLGTFDKRIESWTCRKFIFRLKNNALFENIKFFSENSFKLGLIRFYEKEENTDIEENLKRFKENPVQMKYSVMKFENNLYLLIKIYFSKLNCKFYNVLLSKSVKFNSKSEMNMSYVGSSKKDEFNLCLKLNKNIFIDSTNGSKNEELKINFLIHKMDNLMENLVKTETFLQDSDAVQYLEFNFSTLKLHNRDDKTFLDKVIYDMEIFKAQI